MVLRKHLAFRISFFLFARTFPISWYALRSNQAHERINDRNKHLSLYRSKTVILLDCNNIFDIHLRRSSLEAES